MSIVFTYRLIGKKWRLSMKLIDVKVKEWDFKERTFITILYFSNNQQARMKCKENSETKKMEPLTLSIMNGSCPCCLKPTCSSLQSSKEALFNQFISMKKNAIEFAAGNPRVLLRSI